VTLVANERYVPTCFDFTWPSSGRIQSQRDRKEEPKTHTTNSNSSLKQINWMTTGQSLRVGTHICSFDCSTALVGQGDLIINASRSHSRQTTLRTPLDEWSATRKHLYLTTHNTHKTQTSTPPAGFEPAIPGRERPQTYVFDCAATGIGHVNL